LRITQKIFHQGPELAAELPFLKDMGYDPISNEEAMEIFESFWTSVDREYAMFVIKPDVNWTELHDNFHPQISQVRSLQELWAIIGQMLYLLDDQHLKFNFQELQQIMLNALISCPIKVRIGMNTCKFYLYATVTILFLYVVTTSGQSVNNQIGEFREAPCPFQLPDGLVLGENFRFGYVNVPELYAQANGKTLKRFLK